MSVSIYTPEGCGLFVQNGTEGVFVNRPIRERGREAELEAMRRIARTFVDSPQALLQELVEVAVLLTGADSAGLSVERENGTEEQFYQWLAAAGMYSAFTNAILPRYPSACGLCLERNSAQHFRVGREFFDILGVVAPPVTDGILLPWISGETRGTIFIMAHGREQAFDAEDCRVMGILADFAAMAYQHRCQEKRSMEQAGLAAAASMANSLAHEINNPLQGLTNLLFLAREGFYGEDGKRLAGDAFDATLRLTALVQKILALPGAAIRLHSAD